MTIGQQIGGVRATSPHPSSPAQAFTPGRLLLFALMTTIWGSSFFFTALALESFTPLQIVFIRTLLAGLVLGGALAIIRPPWPRRASTWGHFAFLGFSSIAFPYTLLTWAQVWVDSSSAIVLSSTTPIFVFLIATLAMRTEAFDVTRLLAVLIAFGGVSVLTLGNSPTSANWFWSAVIVLTSAMYAAANVYTKRFVSDVHPLLTAFLQLSIGALWLVPALLVTGEWQLSGPVSLISMLSVLELGILGSAVGYVLFFSFIRSWGSTPTSLNTYLQPLVGVALGVLVLGERPSWLGWSGIGLVLVGVAVFGGSSLLRERRRRVSRSAGRA